MLQINLFSQKNKIATNIHSQNCFFFQKHLKQVSNGYEFKQKQCASNFNSHFTPNVIIMAS